MEERANAPAPALSAAGARKAAILMVAVDAETAARILAPLEKAEQERVALEIVRLESDPAGRDERDAVLREFAGLHLAHQYAEQGGIAYARQVLERIYPAEEVRRIVETVEASTHPSPFGFLQRADAGNLVTFIADEHPQTIALILAHLGPNQAAGLLEGLPPKKQQEVVKRLATLEHTSPEVVEQVGQALETKLASFVAREFRKTGGLEAAAGILNLVQRSTERTILEGVSEESPEMAEQIRRLMFSFADVLRVNDRGVQNLLRNIDMSQLALALKHAPPDIQDKFYRNMSKRAAELVREEIEFLGPVRLSDVEAAQQAIVEVVRRLEDQGELIIEGRPGSEEIIV
jgi:flagellar motor switch protein FliG